MQKDGFNETLLKRKAEDAATLAQRRCEPTFVGFLSDAERVFVERQASCDRSDLRAVFFGGYTDADYTLVGYFPSFLFYDESYRACDDFPITLLCARGSGFRKLTHRDFLGSLMALGIKRETVGDILVSEDGFSAYIFCLDKTAEYLRDNFVAAANDKIVCEICDKNSEEIRLPEKKFEVISATVSSPRLDAILSAALGLSREEASRRIEAGTVSVDHVVCCDKAKACSEGMLLSIRHHGRFLINGFGDRNRRDRLRIVLHHYI